MLEFRTHLLHLFKNTNFTCIVSRGCGRGLGNIQEFGHGVVTNNIGLDESDDVVGAPVDQHSLPQESGHKSKSTNIQ
jgi:hypothetical protein